MPKIHLHDRIARFYRRDVLTVPMKTSFITALDLVERTQLKTIYVLDEGRLEGFINTDLVGDKFIDRKLYQKPLTDVKIEDIMESYTENDERIVRTRQTLKTAASQIVSNSYLDELPVVDYHGKLIGRITLWDLLMSIQSKIDASLKVRTMASSNVITCNKDHSIYYVAANIRASNHNAIIVVDSDDKPTGIICRHNLARELLASPCKKGAKYRNKTVFSSMAFFITAEEVMSRNFIEVHENEDLKRVIGWMVQTRSEIYPVVDDNGKLVRIVSARDIISKLLE
ncbi:MAG: CBS domain-containing protein [Desulfurococcales archaeon]|nr:CBS domain-containing protein [Desulfurococcales archaeon]